MIGVDSSGIDLKTKLDALEKLRNGAWENFNNRRIYGWKMGMGIWTALAAFIGVVLTGRIYINQSLSCCKTFIVFEAFAIVAIMVVYLQAKFLIGIGNAQRIDRDKEFFFENKIMEILTIEFSPELTKKIEDRKKKREKSPLYEWLEFVQLGITIMLILVALALMIINI